MVRVNLQKKQKEDKDTSKNVESSEEPSEENEIVEAAVEPVSLDDSLTEDIFDEFLSQLSEKFENIEINSNILPVMLKESMEIAESSKLEGHLKKLLVNKLIKSLVDKAPISEEEKEACNKLLSSGFLDETMDVIVEISRGNFDVNNLRYKGLNCLFKVMVMGWNKLRIKWGVWRMKSNEKKKTAEEAKEKAKKERDEKKQAEAAAKKKRDQKVKVRVLKAKSVLNKKQEVAKNKK
jgi:hypothetical protein